MALTKLITAGGHEGTTPRRDAAVKARVTVKTDHSHTDEIRASAAAEAKLREPVPRVEDETLMDGS